MKPKKYRLPRAMSLVKFREEGVPPDIRVKYPFVKGQAYLFLGEIKNMPGHCALLDTKSDKNFIGYHPDNFVELTEEEV